jgi:simple sugar transport system permease protein
VTAAALPGVPSGPRPPAGPSHEEEVAAPVERIVSLGRVHGMGIFLLILSLVMLFPFGLNQPASEQATFSFTQPPAPSVPDLVMSVRWVSVVLAVVCAALGVVLITRRTARGAYLIFALGVLCFLWSFLVWVSRGSTLNFTGLLAETMISTTPILFGSLSGILCERSGVTNIAIEGQFLGGAFLAAVVTSASGSLWAGVAAGAVAGVIFGWVLAFLALRYGADQIIVGVLIDAFALGLTNYLLAQVLSPHENLNSPATFAPWAIPGLSKIPIIGPVLFNQNVFVYGVFVLMVAINLGLFRTRWGLRTRAVGEHPRAAATVGVHVISVRYRNVILGGVVAGLGGAALTIGSTGAFSSDISSGLGFVALAAMIFGRWRPYGALGAALLFGFARSLETFLGVLNVSIPAPILSMLPYLITIAVVAGLVGRVRAPAADGVPYTAE